MILQLATERMLAHVDEHGIGWMTFNNPARHNALSLEMWQAIGDILEHFQNDEVDDIWFRGPPPYTQVKNMLFLRTGDAKALEEVGSNAPIHNGAAELIVGSKKGGVWILL